VSFISTPGVQVPTGLGGLAAGRLDFKMIENFRRIRSKHCVFLLPRPLSQNATAGKYADQDKHMGRRVDYENGQIPQVRR